jgi:hypothetical protein
VTALWPWIAVAGLGALHGLNPASGWLGAAACGLRARAVVPMAAGHVVSIALVAGAAAIGLPIGRTALQLAAIVLLACAGAWRLWGRGASRGARASGHAVLALSSFIATTAHGAGLMLVPALAPLCLSDTPARAITASGSLASALAAVGLHAAAMLAVSGILAAVAGRVRDHARGMLNAGSGLKT